MPEFWPLVTLPTRQPRSLRVGKEDPPNAVKDVKGLVTHIGSATRQRTTTDPAPLEPVQST
jgi:hypothetical protein